MCVYAPGVSPPLKLGIIHWLCLLRFALFGEGGASLWCHEDSGDGMCKTKWCVCDWSYEQLSFALLFLVVTAFGCGALATASQGHFSEANEHRRSDVVRTYGSFSEDGDKMWVTSSNGTLSCFDLPPSSRSR